MEELKPCPFCGGEASFMTIKKTIWRMCRRLGGSVVKM